jgi:SAM-dependent methyltransferase
MTAIRLLALLALTARVVAFSADQPAAMRAARVIDGFSDTPMETVTILIEMKDGVFVRNDEEPRPRGSTTSAGTGLPGKAQIAPEQERKGMSREEILQQLRVIQATRGEARQQAVTAFFDRLFSEPAAGFSTAPSPLVEETIKALRPGTALDVGMGQGRNSVYLAGRGWTVTGYDISDQALAAARANAAKAGVTITAVKASHDTFDFGANRWDLIVMTFAWAPVSDPAFVRKLHRSLRPGGVIVYENFVVESGQPALESVHASRPNEAPKLFAGFRVLRSEETTTKGDWGSPNPNGDRLVRLVAQKR